MNQTQADKRQQLQLASLTSAFGRRGQHKQTGAITGGCHLWSRSSMAITHVCASVTDTLHAPDRPLRHSCARLRSHSNSTQLDLPRSPSFQRPVAMFAAGAAAAAAAAAATSNAAAPAPRFWRPGTIAPGSTVEREPTDDADSSMLPVYGHDAAARLPLRQQRMLLPVAGHRREVLWALEQHQVLILVGSTGSGKLSTQQQKMGTMKRMA